MSLLSWSWQGIHTLTLEYNNSCYYNLCASLEIRLISGNYFLNHGNIFCTLFFLEILDYTEGIFFLTNSSLQILTQVWNNALSLHMQAHMQNSLLSSAIYICKLAILSASPNTHRYNDLFMHFDLQTISSNLDMVYWMIGNNNFSCIMR